MSLDASTEFTCSSDVLTAPAARSAAVRLLSATLPLLTAFEPRSFSLTSPLMMSSDPTWFWPRSGPSTAYAVPLRATNNAM